MNFINPAGLWFALLAVPIIIFYLLRIRRKEVEVSSTLLWRMALRDRQANAPWQKLKRNLLLLLQLLILAALVLAAARLAFPLPALTSGAVVLLVDGSASMRASDIRPDRFSAAVETAAEILRDSGADASISAILVNHQPRILFTAETDRADALPVLQSAAPSSGEADWFSAFSLAASLAHTGTGEEDLTYVILSDGGLPEEGLPPLPGLTRYVPIGEGGDNLAVSAFSARTVPAGDRAQLFASIANYGTTERAARLTLSRGTEVLQIEQLRLPAGGSVQVVLENLPVEKAVYHARLENIQSGVPLDDFSPDDEAFAVVAPPPQRTVLLVSAGNLFLERLLLLLPNMEAGRVVPGPEGALTVPAQPFDLYILDGVLPDSGLPDGDLLLVNPPENPLFSVTGVTAEIENARLTDHPLTEFLEWDRVNVFESRQIELPEWAVVLVGSESTPLVFIGETGGRRLAVVAFDLHRSDLPLQIAFPILFANLLDYLAPRGMVANPEGIRPNTAVNLVPGSGTGTLAVSMPDGTQAVFDNPGAEIVFGETEQTGVYSVLAGAGDSFREDAFAVNLFSETESTILPASEIRIGQSAISASGEEEINSREIWGWLIFLALSVLLLEWLAYHRRLG